MDSDWRGEGSRDESEAQRGPDSGARLQQMALLAASGAREASGPLTYLLSNLEYLDGQLALHERDLPPGRIGELRHCLREAAAGARQVRDIVLSMHSPAAAAPDGQVDLHRLLLSCIKVARMEIDHRARVITEFDAIPLPIASESRLRRVFLNLLINAAQAVAGDAEKEQFIRVVTRRGDDGAVVVEIVDSGPGIPEEHLGRVFEPFFTTKPAHEGAGLGLAVCRQVLEEIGGEISVQTALGKGSTFRVTLPTRPPPRQNDGRLTPSQPPVRRLPRRQLG
jgi:two-component system, NtrC family, sensor kinase